MIVDTHAHFQKTASMMNFDWDEDSILRHMDTIGCDYMVQSLCRALEAVPDLEAHRTYAADCKALYEKSNGRVLNYFLFDPRVAEIDLATIDAYHDDPAFRGIKIHPSDHSTWANDPLYKLVWERARDYGLVIMSHTWALTSNPKQKYSTPDQFVQNLEEFPDVNFIFGHSGGRVKGIQAAAEIGRTHKNAYFDMGGDVYNRHFVEYMVEHVGADHLLAASDISWFDLSYQIGMVLGANISTEEKALILGNNAARLFHIA